MWLDDGAESYHLRLIGIDGQGERVLHRDDELEYLQPDSWSPDGRHLAVRTMRNGANQIGLIAVGDGSLRILKSFDWRYPRAITFSPDGRYLAYDFPPRESRLERDIFLLAVDGSHEVRLVDHPAADALLGWAPHGGGVLFVSTRSGRSDLWMAPVANGRPGGAARRLRVDLGGVVPLGITRDGTLFYGVRTGMVEVSVAEIDAQSGEVSKPAPVNQELVGVSHGADWSPDGRWLAHVIRPQSTAELPTVAIRPAGGGTAREIVPQPRLQFIQWLRWSPDGRTLLARAVNSGWGLFAIDAQTGEARPMVRRRSAEPQITQAAWSPDGGSIYYAQGPRILERNVTTGDTRELARRGDNGTVIVSLALSSDGRHLTFAAPDRAARSTDILVLTVAAPENVRTLARVTAPDGVPSSGLAWAADGRSIYFVKRRAGEKNGVLWRVTLDGDRTPAHGGFEASNLRDPRVSPDGRRLAFTAGEDAFEVWAMENFLPPADRAPTAAGRR
jgi:Tol biopolymer transport system component